MNDADLRVLCAEKVLGWRRGGKGDHTKPKHRPSRDYPGTIINDYEAKGEHDYLQQPGTVGYEHRVYFCGCDSHIELPDPLTNGADTVMVLKAISHHHPVIGYDDTICCWHAECLNCNHETRVYVEGVEGFGRAIVLAALKAKGVNVDE